MFVSFSFVLFLTSRQINDLRLIGNKNGGNYTFHELTYTANRGFDDVFEKIVLNHILSCRRVIMHARGNPFMKKRNSCQRLIPFRCNVKHAIGNHARGSPFTT